MGKKNIEKILAITSFPPRGRIHSDKVVGIASYAKNTLTSIGKTIAPAKKVHFEVMAEKLTDETNYKEGKINVKRVWSRNNFGIFPNLILEILKNQRDTKTILIEFELSMFGTLPYLLPFPLFLLFLKLLGKKIIFVCHQVIPDMQEIAPHMNLSHNTFKTELMNWAIGMFYTYVLLVCTKVIVFEEDLKERLTEFGSAWKIVVIPHGVEEFKNAPTREEARKKLKIKNSDFVVMSFGFLAWYKGTDWLIHAINSAKKKGSIPGHEIKLVLAGGPNPNHTDKEYYKRYIKGISKACSENGFILTGFVPERSIPLYFKAADLIVLPYRTFMSASGPLSITFSFNKPFLLSPKLAGVLESEDFKALLKRLKIKSEDLIFQNFNGDLAKKVNKLRRSPALRVKMASFSREARKMRSWDKIGQRYYEEIVN